jgi:hypothetical protein
MQGTHIMNYSGSADAAATSRNRDNEERNRKSKLMSYERNDARRDMLAGAPVVDERLSKRYSRPTTWRKTRRDMVEGLHSYTRFNKNCTRVSSVHFVFNSLDSR